MEKKNKKQNKQKEKSINYWAISTFVLAAIIAITLLGSNISGAAISSKAAGQKVIDFASNQGAEATLVSVEDEGFLYAVTVSIEGQQVPVYITKDGKSLIPQTVPLDEAQPTQAAPNPSAPSQPIEVSVEDRNFKGVEDAKVTIIEYSSFSCGFCDRVRGTLDQILQEYPNDVKIVYKHFDRGGTDSQTAQGSECAGEQGQFWEMHDLIFDKGPNVKSHAEELGLDVNAFNECLDSGKYAPLVAQDTAEAQSNGGRGTPFFIINDKTLSGAQPFNVFKQVIDAELA